MGFNIKHINKYWRWVKKVKGEYKENKFFSRDYAKRCLDLDIALLLKKPENVLDEIAMKKHEWVLNYIKDKCSDTIARYKNMQAPANLNELNSDV